MTMTMFDTLRTWTIVLDCLAHLAVGVIVGIVYFRTLWWGSRRFALGGRTASTVVVMIGRFVLLGGLLTLASQEGAMPLLTLALGILVGRFVVMRGTREVAS